MGFCIEKVKDHATIVGQQRSFDYNSSLCNELIDRAIKNVLKLILVLENFLIRS